MPTSELYWLPVAPNWNEALSSVGDRPDTSAWEKLAALANTRLDLVRTLRLDRHLMRLFGASPPPSLATRPVRLAVLGSSTVDHLQAGIRIGGLRRGLWITTWQGDYGQYAQALSDPDSSLRRWAPTVVLFALDARHVLGGFRKTDSPDHVEQQLAAVTADLVQQWRIARDTLGATVIQQTLLPVFPPLLGNNEHRLAGSPARLVELLNQRLRDLADAETCRPPRGRPVTRRHRAGRVARSGPVAPREAGGASPLTPIYGDLVARLLAAQQGRSFKCLVLDLDNTLWGGVIGDDGLEGIVLGQGSALGEAFVAFQGYARELSRARHHPRRLFQERRGQRARAVRAASRHGAEARRHRLLRRELAATRPRNLSGIAEQLNIGLDCLVFVDDNPFERNHRAARTADGRACPNCPRTRRSIANALADAGYFEAVHLTDEDLQRGRAISGQPPNASSLKASATDLDRLSPQPRHGAALAAASTGSACSASCS